MLVPGWMVLQDYCAMCCEALAQVVRTCPLAIVLACEYAQACWSYERERLEVVQYACLYNRGDIYTLNCHCEAIFAELDRDKAFGIQLDTDELPPEMCQYA
eukprot:2801728-Amphidinium_carterae.1